MAKFVSHSISTQADSNISLRAECQNTDIEMVCDPDFDLYR